MLSILRRDVESVFDIEKIAKAILESCTAVEITISDEERQTYHSYIRIMAELGWPAYNDGDFEFHEQIVELFEAEQYEAIESAIYEHYNEEYIEEIQEFLEEVPLVNHNRLPVLREAFTLYKSGHYYGSVALLTSQIAGIAKDIEHELLIKGISFDAKSEALLSSRYHVSTSSEKAKIIKVILESCKYNDEEREYLFYIGYFRTTFFNDHLKGDDLIHHASRHMIFHGDQLTFGSKEQALKLILCIEMLYWVADVLYYELIECA